MMTLQCYLVFLNIHNAIFYVENIEFDMLGKRRWTFSFDECLIAITSDDIRDAATNNCGHFISLISRPYCRDASPIRMVFTFA